MHFPSDLPIECCLYCFKGRKVVTARLEKGNDQGATFQELRGAFHCWIFVLKFFIFWQGNLLYFLSAKQFHPTRFVKCG